MRQFVCLSVLFFLSPSLFGQIDSIGRGAFLYGIVGKDTSKVSFLFGTLHHLGSEFVFKHQMLLGLARGREVIVTEVDRPTLLAGGAGNLDDFKTDTPLYNLVTRKDYQFLREQCAQNLDRPIEFFDNYTPSLLMEELMRARRKAQRDSTKKKEGMMDAYFQAVAVMDKKPNLGLETADEFLAMAKSIPLHEQAAQLLFAVDMSPEEEKTQIEQPMNKCYLKQSLSCFCKIQDMEHYTMPGDSTMVMKRNLLWMNKLPDILNEKSAFIAVGAAHLCGAYGLVNLLKKKGYTVVPLRY